MQSLTVKQRGFERSALVVRGQTTVAEVFTDLEPGDQYQTAALIAAAPDLLAALREIVAEWDTQHADEDHRTGYTLDTGGIAQARAAIARATGADHA